MSVPSTGGATARPPQAAGRAPRQNTKKNLLYIYIKFCDFIVKYFCLMKIVRALEIFWLRHWSHLMLVVQLALKHQMCVQHVKPGS